MGEKIQASPCPHLPGGEERASLAVVSIHLLQLSLFLSHAHTHTHTHINEEEEEKKGMACIVWASVTLLFSPTMACMPVNVCGY